MSHNRCVWMCRPKGAVPPRSWAHRSFLVQGETQCCHPHLLLDQEPAERCNPSSNGGVAPTVEISEGKVFLERQLCCHRRQVSCSNEVRLPYEIGITQSILVRSWRSQTPTIHMSVQDEATSVVGPHCSISHPWQSRSCAVSFF